ncbi:protein phosphatase 2C domain-containing protein [Paraliomyxa miuraensis]|uniref:protein phosphatase 2C domain-containing protein n=1 Tax=Paraliomyxa miuraensis TaxID=376150 RepID=UPI002258A564|nr:protein phosphatase 2C domain-containing protein [Paraliomyxa miuraensis]MCX4246815.1 protein phosphatase 2C domain-containing protein [Paraliomyxa miuraensis]
MHTDAWFCLGDTHVVCEDFALAGRTALGEAYAIVCDGCSSSPQTDVGARLLALAAQACLRLGRLPDAEEVVERAARAGALLELPPRGLDSTLLVALTDAERCRVRVFGDGVVAARRRDGGLHVHRFEHPDGAPPYPSYGLDPERLAAWRRCCAPVVVEHRSGTGAGVGPEPVCIEHEHTPELTLRIDELTSVTLGSDGLDAMVAVDDGVATPLPVATVLERLLCFPRPQGRFLARRGRRFLRRECARDGWRPTDDLALATILWPEAA